MTEEKKKPMQVLHNWREEACSAALSYRALQTSKSQHFQNLVPEDYLMVGHGTKNHRQRQIKRFSQLRIPITGKYDSKQKRYICFLPGSRRAHICSMTSEKNEILFIQTHTYITFAGYKALQGV